MKLCKSPLISANFLPLLLGLILRSVNFDSPILGVHSWRQADTAAMARHFFLNNTSILMPQIDWAGNTSGYVESEFPLYPYLVGQLYKFFGLNEWLGRSFSVACSVITILLVMRIGRILLDPTSAWWGGLFFALMPLGVYYGRTFQAESLMLLLAALSIERMLIWKLYQRNSALFLSWLTLCLASLMKVLPLIWLGLPLLFLYFQNQPLKESLNNISFGERFRQTIRSPHLYIYTSLLIAFCILWYWHAYQLGQNSGLTFGFWGSSSDRSSLRLILSLGSWLNLLLRISLRNLALIGVPLLLIGVWNFHKKKDIGLYFMLIGLLGMFLCTLIASRSSFVHEYYQLPIQLFACPLMGRGWVLLVGSRYGNFSSKSFRISILAFILIISLIILNFDYWAVERRQTQVWMPLVERIRKEVPLSERIVSVTGSDPTLLNLARRQGWLTKADNIDQSKLKLWADLGATYIVGSFDWEETYRQLPKGKIRENLKENLCINKQLSKCIDISNGTYLLPLQDLIK